MGRFSTTVMEHFQDPQNRGRLECAGHFGVVGTPGRGMFFIMALNIENDIVLDARFDCNGCGASVASGSVLTSMIRGRSVAECQGLVSDDLLTKLDGLPVDKRHCAANAITALQRAITGQVDGEGNT
ncbi:MAG: iron-sulfur cluster assembly scaffold protein [Planctomycetaceae bacterium]|nr:iron-sulfur cluster assembly scaffold protein [Planctomycetaceae bacterium]